MTGYGYEVDFLPVGSGDKSGDAIVLRYGEAGSYKVMVVDGGTKESGEKIVDHIKEHYGTTHVDYLVNTHPDSSSKAARIQIVSVQPVQEVPCLRRTPTAGALMRHSPNPADSPAFAALTSAAALHRG